MTVHLSSEQIAENVLGQPSAGQLSSMVARHVEQCLACRAEVASFRESLGEFRSAVRSWSDQQAATVLAIPADSPKPRFWKPSHQLAWALLLAGVCVIASFVVPHNQQQASSDIVLLNQVDTEVSRTVPSSMEPLMKLMAEQ
jgi:anti-sigma factor RsiW